MMDYNNNNNMNVESSKAVSSTSISDEVFQAIQNELNVLHEYNNRVMDASFRLRGHDKNGEISDKESEPMVKNDTSSLLGKLLEISGRLESINNQLGYSVDRIDKFV